MFKSTGLLVTLGICFSTILLLQTGIVSAESPIIQRLDAIQDTLDSEIIPHLKVGVPKTGQIVSYAPGDDGDLQKGVFWPGPRFTDNGDGTVTDNLTRLIWLKDANRFGQRTWPDALDDCNTLEGDGSELTDGSQAGDWRLPNIREFHSLIDYGNKEPALPSGHPFTGVQSLNYWSGTTVARITTYVWFVAMVGGSVATTGKGNYFYVWPVRDPF